MPSNQCTNTLMELSFAVGNMIGDQRCQSEDWDQLRDILNGWECSTRGDAGDAKDNMMNLVGDAKKACAASEDDICPPSYCVDLFQVHEELVQAMNVYDVNQVGTGKRGPIPPKVKGPEGVGRTGTLLAQRREEMRRANQRDEARKAAEAAEKARLAAERAAEREARRISASGEATGEAARFRTPGMGTYGNGEARRKRWYPERSMA